MHWSDDFIAVDWGTTNRRAYRIAGDACVDELEDECGVMAVAAGGFPAGIAMIRERLGDKTIVMAGMVGSTRGWVDVPYVPCPAGAEDLAARVHWVEPGRVAIVPGLSYRGESHADVMRGEEVQMFGALASAMIPPDAIVCHPGTHNKWIAIAGGRVDRFRTVMTGEMFGLLRDHGILAEMLGGEVQPGRAFEAGVARGIEAPLLTAELFTVRARVLLGDLQRDDAASFVSGLLIGADLAFGRTLADGAVIHIMGEPELTRLYAAAARQADQAIRQIEGRDAFVAGAIALARKMK